MRQELRQKLVELGFTEEMIDKLVAEGAVTEADIAKLTAGEIKSLVGCGLVTAKKAIETFSATEEAETALATKGVNVVTEVLPALPADDESYVAMLKTGGVLKVEAIDVLAAVRAGIANQIGIEKVPNILVRKMETFAQEQGEPVGETFYTILALITARSYGEILQACGISGHFMSKERKNAFLDKLNAAFWKTLADFQSQLDGWWTLWSNELQSTGIAMLAYKGDDVFSELSAPPDTGTLRAAAEVLFNRINQVFAGTGIPVARALAYDITQIRKLLSAEGLPAAVGCTTKEQLLKMIGRELNSSIEADYVLLELNVAKYIFGIMKLSEVPAAREQKYLIGLRRLGKMIAWEKLGCPIDRGAEGGATLGRSSFRD